MRQKPIQHHIDALAALLLFGIFAACLLAVLLTGANAYHRLTQRDQAAFDRRSCVQYLTTRVRQSDQAGGISVESFGGCDALVLDANTDYPTWIYCWEGELMELYCSRDAQLSPEDGTPLMELDGMELALDDGLLTIGLTAAGGRADTLALSLRGGEGDAP